MAYGVLLVTGSMTHQEGYAAGFRADPRCRIIAVTDEANVGERRAELNRRMAEQLGVPLIPDLDQALARRDVDLVSICAEHDRQGRVAIRCAEAGKHIYIDKPLAGDLEQARRLEQMVTARRLKSQMFTHIGQPWTLRLRRALPQVGELRAIHNDLHFAKGYAAAFPPSRRKEHPRPERFLLPEAKREMFNIAVYSLALIRWLSGGKAFRSVRAVTGNYILEWNRRHDFEDFAVLAAVLEGGLTATISAGRTGWRSHPAAGHNRTRLFGTRAAVTVDAWDARGELCGDRLPHWSTPALNPEDPHGFWASTDQRKRGCPEWFLPPPPAKSDQSLFLDCLEQDRAAEVTVADGVRVLEALFAAYRSAASGAVEPVI
jgi:predicted dehydrogenase